MRRRACLVLPAALPWLPGCAVSPPAVDGAAGMDADLRHAAALRDAGLRDAHAWRLVRELAAGIGPRPAGSAGDARAVAWAQGALIGLGLQAVWADPVPLRVWQRGPARPV